MGIFDRLFKTEQKKQQPRDESAPGSARECPKREDTPPLGVFSPHERALLCNAYRRDEILSARGARAEGGRLLSDPMIAEIAARLTDAELDALIDYHKTMEQAESLGFGADRDEKYALLLKAHRLVPCSIDCLEKIYEHFAWWDRPQEALPWLVRIANEDLDRAEHYMKDLLGKLGEPLPPDALALQSRFKHSNCAAFFRRFFSQLAPDTCPLDKVREARDSFMPGGGLWVGSCNAISEAIARLLDPLPVDNYKGNIADAKLGVSFVVSVVMANGISRCRLRLARLESNLFGVFGDGIVQDWDESQGPLPDSALRPRAVKPKGSGPMDRRAVRAKLDELLPPDCLKEATPSILESGRKQLQKESPQRTGLLSGSRKWVLDELSELIAARRATAIEKARYMYAVVDQHAVLITVRTEKGGKIEIALLRLPHERWAAWGDEISEEREAASDFFFAPDEPEPAKNEAPAGLRLVWAHDPILIEPVQPPPAQDGPICRCDTCNRDLMPREVFAISPRADMPKDSADVYRLLCEEHFKSVFEYRGRNVADGHALARTNRTAQQHIIAKGGVRGFAPLKALDPLHDPGQCC